MKHLGKVTLVPEHSWREFGGTEPGFADAKSDFQNSLWRRWWDYVLTKKTGAM